jgi:predicted amidohydrolase
MEEGLQFWGGSRLVSPTGDVLAKAKYDEEDFLCVEADFNDLRTAETFIPTLRDLRPELFDKLKTQSENI